MWTSGERRASGWSAAGTTCSSKCGAHCSRKAAIDSGECASEAATSTTVRGAAIEPVAPSKKSNPADKKRPAAAADGKKGGRKASRKV